MKSIFGSNRSLLVILWLFSSFIILKAQSIPKEIDDALDKIGAKMMKTTLDGEYLKLVEYYSDDVTVMPDFHPAIRGKKSLLEQYEKEMEKGVKYHSFSVTVEKRWKKEDEIFERGTFGMAVSSKNSRKPAAYYGSYFQIWKRQSDGSYKMTFTIWNLDFNPFE